MDTSLKKDQNHFFENAEIRPKPKSEKKPREKLQARPAVSSKSPFGARTS